MGNSGGELQDKAREQGHPEKAGTVSFLYELGRHRIVLSKEGTSWNSCFEITLSTRWESDHRAVTVEGRRETPFTIETLVHTWHREGTIHMHMPSRLNTHTALNISALFIIMS